MHYVDVGTSGGVAGLERGYCLMIGGEAEVVDAADADLRGARARASRRRRARPGAAATAASAEQGFLHCGPHGAGHFVKMVHNGIEYGVMAAYAEGLNILRNANVGKREHAADAETTPLRHPEFYQYDMNLPDDRRGLAPRQRDRLVAARPDRAARCSRTRELAAYGGRVSDSGEGRWTIAAAIDEGGARRPC